MIFQGKLNWKRFHEYDFNNDGGGGDDDGDDDDDDDDLEWWFNDGGNKKQNQLWISGRATLQGCWWKIL